MLVGPAILSELISKIFYFSEGDLVQLRISKGSLISATGREQCRLNCIFRYTVAQERCPDICAFQRNASCLKRISCFPKCANHLVMTLREMPKLVGTVGAVFFSRRKVKLTVSGCRVQVQLSISRPTRWLDDG